MWGFTERMMADGVEERVSGRELSRQLEELDGWLLGAVAGQEPELLAVMDRRTDLLRRWVEAGPGDVEREGAAERTRRLQEKFLHWRRSAIMEQSAIDQHSRFLQEQRLDDAAIPAACLDIQA